MRLKTISKDRTPRARKAARPETAARPAPGTARLEALETLFGHDPEKATRPVRSAIGPGRMLALGALVFLLSGPVPAGETEESTEASSKESGAVLVDDAGLVKVHGRGAELPVAVPSQDAGVILWDERGQGGQNRHSENRTTGSGNVQGTGLILNRR